MTTPSLVIDFYQRIWNAGNKPAVSELLSEEFVFRGSLGAEMSGRARFWEIGNALSDGPGGVTIVIPTAGSSYD